MENGDFPGDLAVRVRNVGKTYRLGVISRRTLRDELAYRWLRLRGRDPKESMGRVGGRELEDPGLFRALDDVSFDVRQGETVGLIGRNGAGKSTMLKILARITTPSSGEAWIRGRVGSMLEVGTGFHPELTGRENVYLNGTILGMTKKEIDAKFDEIVEFSEIGEFLDTPVKRYSSGMYVKLAFSIASSLDNDVLLLDEVLAVGDAAFRRKSLARMKEIAASGRTILFVSHSKENVKTVCSRCLWFDRGRIVQDGPTEEVLDAYEGTCAENDAPATHALLRNATRREPLSGTMRFTEISVLDETGREREPRCGDRVRFRLSFEAREEVRECELSIGVRSKSGNPLLSLPTRLTQSSFPLARGLHEAELVLPRMPLTPGVYSVDVSAKSGGRKADFVEKALWISVTNGDFFGTGGMVAGGLSGRVILCDHSWVVDPS